MTLENGSNTDTHTYIHTNSKRTHRVDSDRAANAVLDIAVIPWPDNALGARSGTGGGLATYAPARACERTMFRPPCTRCS